ncbi:MAG: GNAT family N-acetyltransferase [Oscillatoria sp. SIO1A7]|nr:GNAT family N-acetyltransferase [Oscillatoria sp. SIO1A7]
MLEIRLAQTPEEREQVFKLRYQIHVEELGWVDKCENYEPNHETKTIEEPLDRTGYIFGAFEDGELAGTIRINYAKNLEDSEEYAKLYKMREYAGDAHPLFTSITSRLMVPHHLRGKRIGLKLMQAGYKQQLVDGIKFDFIDCENHMVPFFEKIGYQLIGSFEYEVYGNYNIMVLDLLNSSG